jgi:hypothetical protein
MVRNRKHVLLVLGLAVLVSISASAGRFCPADPEIMCGMTCTLSGPSQGWCSSGGAATQACVLVLAGPGTHGGCIGGFTHCSCNNPGG